MSSLAATLQSFFTDRLVRQRQASPRTVAAYRDTFRLLLGFVQSRTGRASYTLGLEHIDASASFRSSTILRWTATTLLAHATHGSPRCAPYSATRLMPNSA